MSAPTPTARGTPAGIKLKDGFSTKITFANNATISFWEKDVQPPGIDGGEPIDQTTMHNVAYITKRAQALKDYKNAQSKVAYDPNVYASGQVDGQINYETTITVTFPDGSTLAFYGYLKEFNPDRNTRGSQPEAEIVIVPTNWDPVGNVEAGPAIASAANT